MDLFHFPPYADPFNEDAVPVFFKLIESLINDYIDHSRTEGIPISVPDFAVGLIYKIGHQDGQTEIVTLKPGMWPHGEREKNDE